MLKAAGNALAGAFFAEPNVLATVRMSAGCDRLPATATTIFGGE